MSSHLLAVDEEDSRADVLIPYTRFLEVRARRLDIAAELSQPGAQRTSTILTKKQQQHRGRRVSQGDAWAIQPFYVVATVVGGDDISTNHRRG